MSKLDEFTDYLFARWGEVLKGLAELNRPAPTDTYRTEDGKCDGSCNRRNATYTITATMNGDFDPDRVAKAFADAAKEREGT